VPKYLIKQDGSLGERNDVRCVSIEHKLGIHASPTCTMSYGDEGGAVGYLIGEPNQGMRFMFTMMNNARLSVGLEGLALAERAYQAAVGYAWQRRQGRAVGATGPEPSLIVEHPDVRRMLLTIKAYAEAMRCLLYLNAESIDLARHHDDPDVRQGRQELVDLLTPVSKAWCTDLGVELTSLAVQVYGGMGYVEESGVALYFRDSRIAPTYEGSNGIQAIDLVMRKLPTRGGAVVKDQLAAMAAVADNLAAGGEGGDGLAGIGVRLAEAVAVLQEASDWLLDRVAGAPNDALAGATPYLRMFGLVTGGWLMARSAQAASRLLSSSAAADPWLSEKIATAQFYASQLLPQACGLLPAVTAGSAGLFAVTLT
jgi:3-(methylthio)propanoyl-CoA dehydrogenase